MKTNKELFNVSKLFLAVQGALIAMLAMPIVAFADDNDVKTLTHPANTIDLSVGNVSADSAKFGEYNGLNKKGPYMNGDFSIRGGDAYDSFNGGEGTWRWQFKGTEIGTTSRALSEEVSDQGKWNLGIGFDQLRHQISDTYQTPLVGSMGGNNFTTPAGFGYINTGNAGTIGNTGGNTGTTAAQVGTPVIQNGFTPKGTQILAPSQLADFNSPNVYSERQNASLTAGYNFDQSLALKFDFNQLVQSGAKLMAVSTDGSATGVNTFFGQNVLQKTGGPLNTGIFAKESPMIVMNPTNYKTDTFNLALNWAGDKAFVTTSYYASLFTDNYNGLTFPNMFVSGGAAYNNVNYQPNSMVSSAISAPADTISTAPSNILQQINMNGGYTISSATKLTGGLSYARNNQNETFTPNEIMQAGVGVYPQSSLNGQVITTHADLKLTNQTTKDLQLVAGLKFNQRDNQTASNQYNWIDLGVAKETAVSIPMSNKKTQLELGGDYRIDHNNRIHLGIERETINRWCKDPFANSGQSTAPAVAGYTANSCVQVADTNENKLLADYKLRASENLNFNAGYSYSSRVADLNSDFYSPLHANLQGYEKPGYVAFFDASRREQVLKVGVNWQANDKLTLSLNGRTTKDTYPDSTLGVQDSHAVSANMDATYSYSENNEVSAYLSWQERQRNLDNAAGNNATVNQVWTNNMTDNSTTAGINSKQKGLMGGKFGLSEDVTYSIDKSNYSTSVPYYVPTATAPTCDAATALICGSTPDIKSDMLRFKLSGSYQLDKSSKVNVGYTFQRLISTDYYYNALQYGYTPTSMLPSNQQAPSYTVNVISASYAYNF